MDHVALCAKAFVPLQCAAIDVCTDTDDLGRSGAA